MTAPMAFFSALGCAGLRGTVLLNFTMRSRPERPTEGKCFPVLTCLGGLQATDRRPA
jgi:hypothetical protein